MPDNKAAALMYAARGWHVFPLRAKTKEPATEHGMSDATTDFDTIEAWWAEDADYNIGINCAASGLMVVDVDVRYDGHINLTRLMEDHGQQDSFDELTLTAKTGGGGWHYVFKLPEGRLRGKLCDGVDIKAKGYIVAPDSTHPDGGTYQWVNALPVADAPAWVIELVTRSEEMPAPREYDPSDTRPGTLFNLTMPWEDILRPAGWTLVDTIGAEQIWRRPGKTEGISATTNYEDSGLFYPFTTSTDFDTRGYDKVGVYAVLNFGGDVAAALADITATYVANTYEPDRPSEEARHLLQLADGDDAGREGEDALPEVVRNLQEGHFVRRYMDYAALQTDASPEYHEAAALVLLSTVTKNLRVNLAPYPGGLRTNLYVVLVGSTTRSRKSTSQNIALDLAETIVPYGILGAKATTEALVRELARKSGLSTVWMPDEFGMTIAEIGRREFLRGVEELLLTCYGGKEYVYTTVKETITVSSSHLSILGAATPESLALAGPTAMLGGLFPRFAVVFPRHTPEARPAGSVDGLAPIRSGLVHDLREITQFADSNTECVLSEEALAILNKEEAAFTDKGPHVARLPIMLYKVAALYAAGRLSSVVEKEDAEAAVATVNRWKHGADNLRPFLRRKAADIEFDQMLFSTLDILRELGGEANRWVVARRVGTTKPRMDLLQATLEDRGYIKVERGTSKWTLTD